jgi:hypothetical protein
MPTHMQDVTESQTDECYTPDEVLIPTRRYFGGRIPLDPCTHPSNPTRARRFYTPADNGLTKEFSRKGTFINPPYGRKFGMYEWLEKIRKQAEKGRTIIALLPMGTRYSTDYWQRDVLIPEASAVCWPKKRLQFTDHEGNPRMRWDEEKKKMVKSSNMHDSSLYLFNGNPYRFAVYFGDLGKVYRLEALA